MLRSLLQTFFSLFLGLSLSTIFSCSSSTETAEDEDSNESDLCDNSAITGRTYLLAFHACATDCNTPTNHVIYLAGSDDGIAWSLIEAFEPRAGSVPDLVFYNDFLYLFHTGSSEHWAKLNACFGVVETGSLTVHDSTGEDTGGFVDPSAIVSGEDLVLFYLPGVLGADPAGCSAYPCTKEIHSALADDTTLATFTRIDGSRAEKSLSSGTFSDPDIVEKSVGTYLLYVSSGPSTLVYSGNALTDTFQTPTGSSGVVSNNTGGVASGIEGTDGNIWLYVTTTQSGIEVIRRATSSDGISEIASSSFETVINSSISSGFTPSMNVSSPSIIAWPSATWSREKASE